MEELIRLKAGEICGASLAEIVEAVEVRVVRGVLRSTGGRIQDAAITLGISREGLYKAMKRLGIELGFGRG